MQNSPAASSTTTPSATTPSSTAPTSPWTRRAAWAAPPTLAAVVLLHRNDPVEAMDLAGSTTTWIWIHVVLLGALTLLAHAIRTLLTDVSGPAASIARGLLPFALVTYAAFDALVGLGTGVMVARAESLGPEAAQLVEHWWSVPSPISGIAALAQLSWATVLGATAIARGTRGAPRFLVPVLVALAGSFPLLHVRPIGLVPVALLAAALWLNEQTSGTADEDPVVVGGRRSASASGRAVATAELAPSVRLQPAWTQTI